MFDRYTPKPFHQFIPFSLIMVAAIVFGSFPNWGTGSALIAALIIGVRTSIWIANAGEKREESEYWNNLGYDLRQLRHSRPEVWEALGFNSPPTEVYLKSEVTGEQDKSPIMEQENYKFEMSPSELRYMADELLSGKKTLAEKEWIGTPIGSTRVRDIKQKMIVAGLIAKAHPTAKTQGFLLTEKGIRYLWEYADDWAKKMYEQKQVNTLAENERPPYPPPSSAYP